MNFRDQACEHLSQYKCDILDVKKDGIYNYRGRKVPKSHILPTNDYRKNILKPYRDAFFASDQAQIKFHKYFHHLNSSQALCINLFYPLIAENSLNLFLKYLKVSPETPSTFLFEKDSDLEVAARRTSFDFYVQLTTQSQVFVEVKYTEDGFGQAKKDSAHREKFHTTYLPILQDKEAFLLPECQDEELFLSRYQVLRNLVHINDTDTVVLLFPSANIKVAKEAVYAKSNFLTERGKDRLRIVYLEEFVSSLATNPLLQGYYQAFQQKYLPANKIDS